MELIGQRESLIKEILALREQLFQRRRLGDSFKPISFGGVSGGYTEEDLLAAVEEEREKLLAEHEKIQAKLEERIGQANELLDEERMKRAELMQENESLQQEIKDQEEKHKEEIASLNKAHEAEKAKMKEEHEKELANVRAEMEAKITKLTQELEQLKEKMAEMEEQMIQLSSEVEKEKQRADAAESLADELKEALEVAQAAAERLKAEYEEKFSKMSEEMESMKEKEQQREEELKKNVEALTKAIERQRELETELQQIRKEKEEEERRRKKLERDLKDNVNRGPIKSSDNEHSEEYSRDDEASGDGHEHRHRRRKKSDKHHEEDDTDDTQDHRSTAGGKGPRKSSRHRSSVRRIRPDGIEEPYEDSYSEEYDATTTKTPDSRSMTFSRVIDRGEKLRKRREERRKELEEERRRNIEKVLMFASLLVKNVSGDGSDVRPPSGLGGSSTGFIPDEHTIQQGQDNTEEQNGLHTQGVQAPQPGWIYSPTPYELRKDITMTQREKELAQRHSSDVGIVRHSASSSRPSSRPESSHGMVSGPTSYHGSSHGIIHHRSLSPVPPPHPPSTPPSLIYSPRPPLAPSSRDGRSSRDGSNRSGRYGDGTGVLYAGSSREGMQPGSASNNMGYPYIHARSPVSSQTGRGGIVGQSSASLGLRRASSGSMQRPSSSSARLGSDGYQRMARSGTTHSSASFFSKSPYAQSHGPRMMSPSQSFVQAKHAAFTQTSRPHSSHAQSRGTSYDQLVGTSPGFAQRSSTQSVSPGGYGSIRGGSGSTMSSRGAGFKYTPRTRRDAILDMLCDGREGMEDRREKTRRRGGGLSAGERVSVYRGRMLSPR
ncbi:hypothetical protein ADUPG1_011930 [Aduncisulcus paluster]|uniref:Uncharacterized protein n=1 Tax=Aduncisulcus paluster TaxID=2918883 RepID=A0ABQ5JXQ2_9EUKA|nr:hypothetical protein ADUPG1_011930 [Aduncisulcus paluster]